VGVEAKMIEAVTGLLGCQLIGELVARGLGLSVPGPVLGLVLLFVFLVVRHGEAGAPPEALERVSGVLLGNLGLLFVPAGVGVMVYLPLLAASWLPIGLAVVVGTLGGAVFTGVLASVLLRVRR
jgi:holin-like protein